MILGAPALGLSLAATTLNAYLPVLAQAHTSSRFVMGAMVGGEGFVALLLPVWVGAASDRVETRLGPRLPFLIATAPVAAAALALLPLGRSILALIVLATLYYLAYFTFYAPYRALVSDLVPRDKSGRANGIQGVFRGAGMGGGLVGGALLFQLWNPLPYLVAASVLIATTAVAVLGLRNDVRCERQEEPHGSAPAEVWGLVRDHPAIRDFIVANGLWQMTEAGLRSFIVLYLTRGLRMSLSFAALAMSIVAVAALVASPFAGKLADRYGPRHVMRVVLVVFGAGLWLATFTHEIGWLLLELPFVGVGGVIALSLPYALLMRIMPGESHGAAAGLFDVSGGAGSLLGPIMTGVAIDALHRLFPSTDGYGAMWPVLGTATLLSLVFLRERRGREPSPFTPGVSGGPAARRGAAASCPRTPRARRRRA